MLFIAIRCAWFLGFGVGTASFTKITGFSHRWRVVLAVIRCFQLLIFSGPPTLRAGIPTANPSAYIGAFHPAPKWKTPVAIAIANSALQCEIAQMTVVKLLNQKPIASVTQRHSRQGSMGS